VLLSLEVGNLLLLIFFHGRTGESARWSFCDILAQMSFAPVAAP
jgi:hypothetical protein